MARNGGGHTHTRLTWFAYSAVWVLCEHLLSVYSYLCDCHYNARTVIQKHVTCGRGQLSKIKSKEETSEATRTQASSRHRRKKGQDDVLDFVCDLNLFCGRMSRALQGKREESSWCLRHRGTLPNILRALKPHTPFSTSLPSPAILPSISLFFLLILTLFPKCMDDELPYKQHLTTFSRRSSHPGHSTNIFHRPTTVQEPLLLHP